MPTALQCLAAAAGPDGRIYAMGETDKAGNNAYAYTPGTRSWATVAPMSTARSGLGAATGRDGRIYAIGGNTSGVTNSVEAYSPGTNSWAYLASMRTARGALTAVTGPDGRIYAIGGSTTGVKGTSSPTNTVEAYTPSTNSWATVAPMPTARMNLAAATGPDGRIYVIGGGNGSTCCNTVEAYNPTTNSWAAVASLATARNALGAATGPDGRIYAIAGDVRGTQDTVEAYDTTPNPVVPPPAAAPLGPSTPPSAAPSPLPGGSSPSGGHRSGATAAVPSTITSALPKPAEAFSSVQRTVASAAIAAVAILLITFPAQLFNRTFEENYDEIVGFWERRVPWLKRARDSLAGTRDRKGNLVVVGAVLLIGALLGGFLDPHFGFNASAATTYLSVVLAALWGIAVSTSVVFAYRKLRHRDTNWRLRALPAGLLIAAGCVAISRVSDFQPGYLYGIICVAAFAAVLAKHEQGHAVALATVVTVILAFVAWFAWVPVNAAAARPGASWPLIELDDVLGAVFTGGLIGATIGMIPLRFLPGGALAAWHRGVWAAVSGVVTFAFVAIMLNPGRGGSPGRASLVTAIVLFVVFGGGSVLFALYFARRKHTRAYSYKG
jgi:N-acetylneuraminic acid mutarotase